VRFGIPLYGTMAHSLVQAHDDEGAAFRAFARADPQHVVLLLDTYDTEAAAEKVAAIAPELARDGVRIRGVRLDSGDLAGHARRVREILDRAGLRDVTIFVSGNLDEDAVGALVTGGAPIDGFGLGTRLDTSADAPYLDCAYKLESYAGTPRRKRSEGKATWPGAKQVWRRLDGGGRMAGDVIGLEDENVGGASLVLPVMRAGRLVGPLPTLAEAREHAAAELARLPEELRRLDDAYRYPVAVSERLRALARDLDRAG